MATYCFRCRTCGATGTSNFYGVELICCHKPMGRDYQAENVGTAIANLKREREYEALGDATGGMASILPTHDDFKSPEDPDGKKGLRKWREEHEPKHPEKGDPIGQMVARDRLST